MFPPPTGLLNGKEETNLYATALLYPAPSHACRPTNHDATGWVFCINVPVLPHIAYKTKSSHRSRYPNLPSKRSTHGKHVWTRPRYPTGPVRAQILRPSQCQKPRCRILSLIGHSRIRVVASIFGPRATHKIRIQGVFGRKSGPRCKGTVVSM